MYWYAFNNFQIFLLSAHRRYFHTVKVYFSTKFKLIIKRYINIKMKKSQSYGNGTKSKNQRSNSKKHTEKSPRYSKKTKENEKKVFQDEDSMHKPKTYQEVRKSSNTYPSQYCYESEYEYPDYTPDFQEPTFEDHPKNKNFEQKRMKEKMSSSVDQYKNSKASFSRIYHRWLPERRNTLLELRTLLEDVRENAKNYYEVQSSFKELSLNSRGVKGSTENGTTEFFASFVAFMSDAASGITSFTQAVKVDSYQNKFQELMDHDAEITKDMYVSRSQCISKYQGIEEVIRKFETTTLSSTVNKISDTLHLDKHMTAMKNAYQQNDMSKLLDEVGNFFENICQSEVLEDVNDTVCRYVDDNPAALEACKSTGKAVYGAIDTFGEKRDRNSAICYAKKATNFYLMADDKKEVDHFKSMISDETRKSKLESQIEMAIDSLESEMEEMKDVYFQLFNICDRN